MLIFFFLIDSPLTSEIIEELKIPKLRCDYYASAASILDKILVDKILLLLRDSKWHELDAITKESK